MQKTITKFKKQVNLSAQIALVAGIILVLNFLSYQIFIRFDLTENKIYSISDISKNTMKNLDDAVNIKAYFSEDLPPQYLSVKQEVEDILDEYQNYAKNKLRVEFTDPKDDEELEIELRMLGIPKLQFNVLENDKYQVIGGYLGIAIEYGDKQQGIPVVDDIRNLEYQLTSAIKKVTIEEVPTVAFATGHEELDRSSDINLINEKLTEIYTMRSVDLTTGDMISEDINTLIIAGSKAGFTERELYVIDQFIMSGGSVIFLIDGVIVDDSLLAGPNEATLEKLLSAYGAKVERQFVLDTSNEMASFNQGFITFSTQYPFFVRVGQSGFDKENAIVAKLRNLIFPWTSPITIDYSKNPQAQISVLAKTTSDAWLMSENFNLQPQSDFGYNPDPETYNLAAVISGKLNSAFDAYVPQTAEAGDHIQSAENARVAVIGDSDFAKDNFMSRYPDNLLFLQNLVDAVSLDSDLINIRSKEASERPLEEIDDGRKKTIKYLNIFGITLIVLTFGLIRYYRRKKSKFADEL